MRLNWAGLALVALLIGCGQVSRAPAAPEAQQAQGYAVGGESGETRSLVAADADAPAQPAVEAREQNATDMRATIDQTTRGRAPGGGANQPAQTSDGVGNPVMLLAYTYQTTLELPADRLTGVMDAHVKACQDAGPRFCQLIGSSRSGDPTTAMSGQVDIRGEPHWLHSFMGNLAHQADAAGGRILSQSTSTEDLTRSIVDTEANLRAQKTLRDRLQGLLASHPGRLSDLLDVERELARVQGEIDSTQSQLAVMRTRVDMSELTLSYQSSAKPLRSDTFRPLGEAFAGFLGIVVMGFAMIVTVIAVLIPIAIVVGPIVWLILRWRARRKAKKAAAQAT